MNIAVWPDALVSGRARARAHHRTAINSISVVAPNNYNPHPWIVQTPGTCGGQPRIDGTRITVRVIAEIYWQGEGLENIANMFGLELWQVEKAIAYANSHRTTIEFLIHKNNSA